MTARRREHIKAIFDFALGCEPAARAEFLEWVGSTDPDLRREVDSLLAAPNAGTASTHQTGGLGDAELGTPLEIAHVLFTDIVGYSLLPMEKQKDYLAQLQHIVQHSPRFRAAEASGEIVSLPTGDGMALAFLRDPIAPIQCALEVSTELKSRAYLKLRMGINSGAVYRVSDVNAKANVAGIGINMAQRVMDCGDAGHILVSSAVADPKKSS
jgi:class 3 adenylate cyclase